jgi:CDP-diacylglycerol--glycerol-3-phosphate 3-phosphatidyltransferase
MLDGYLARKFKWSSTFGKLIDPLADKMLQLSAMIMLIPLGRIPAWLVTLLFIREVMITSLRGLATERRLVISASHLGKYKSAFLASATVGLLIHYPLFGINWQLIGWVLLVPGVFFSLASGLQYTILYFRKYGIQ